MSLRGKVAIVTAGAMGIGRASALRLAADGADVVVMDKAESELQDTARAIEVLGRKALPITVDLLDRTATAAAFAHARAAFGPADILHNNAGQSARERMKPFWEADPEVWDFILDLNVGTAMFCSRQVVNDMRERRRGRIICTSSEAAYVGGSGATDYCTSKAGILGFVRSLAVEMAPFGVTVNAVLPGVTRTRMMDKMSRDHLAPIIQSIPMGRICEPEDIAHVVSFYASDGARLVTGTGLLVNGGRVMA